jgi:hypothetical protein
MADNDAWSSSSGHRPWGRRGQEVARHGRMSSAKNKGGKWLTMDGESAATASGGTIHGGGEKRQCRRLGEFSWTRFCWGASGRCNALDLVLGRSGGGSGHRWGGRAAMVEEKTWFGWRTMKNGMVNARAAEST